MIIRRPRILACAAVALLCGCTPESTVQRLAAPATFARPLANGAGGVLLSAAHLNPRLLRRFAPIHAVMQPNDAELVDLGRLLFFDPRLSSTRTISCNSCHPLDQYGTTNTRVSTGIKGRLGRRNAPTVYNAAGHFREFWDGRAGTLEEQALFPLANSAEMGMTPTDILRTLRRIPGYGQAFARAFPAEQDPLSMINVGRALAAFERGLNTPARWDRFLEGDLHALTDEETRGAKLFANLGCLSCHSGAYVGGAMFAKVGLVHDWSNQTDRGRFEVTHDPADELVFKVPSLRNVARTAPYFHDGSAATLEEAVKTMAFHQLGLTLGEEQVRDIVAWMGSLTGDIPQAYVKQPQLPPTGAI